MKRAQYIFQFFLPIIIVISECALVLLKIVQPGQQLAMTMLLLCGTSVCIGTVISVYSDKTDFNRLMKDPCSVYIDRANEKFQKNNQQIESLTIPERTLLLSEWFFNEIYNGGLDQFYSNSTGYFAYETIDALKEIKAYHAAKKLTDFLCLMNLKLHETKLFDKRSEAISKYPEGIQKFYEKGNRIDVSVVQDKIRKYFASLKEINIAK